MNAKNPANPVHPARFDRLNFQSKGIFYQKVSNKFTAEHVDQRIEAFFKSYISEQLTEKNVNQAVQSLIKLRLAADITLDEEMNRNWQEILGREYVFDRRELQASILSSGVG